MLKNSKCILIFFVNQISCAALFTSMLGCGKLVKLNDITLALGSTANGKNPAQPTKTVGADTKIDFLFIADTSHSLDSRRSRLSKIIPQFIAQIDPAIDYQIGVMLAHGGASPHSGRLYAPLGSPLVLSSKLYHPHEIQTFLSNTLNTIQRDVDEAYGEALLYSLSNSLTPEHLTEIRNAGFYRDDAALAIILITDEHDLCYPTQSYNSTSLQNFTPVTTGSEVIGYRRYCINPSNGKPSITSSKVFSWLKQLKSSKQLSLAGIVHRDGTKIPKGKVESIGYGVIELVQSDPHGILMEVADSDFRTQLNQLVNTLVNESQD